MQSQKFKNPKPVRDYLAKIKREYRARKKQEKLEASAPRLPSKDTLAATAGAVTANE